MLLYICLKYSYTTQNCLHIGLSRTLDILGLWTYLVCRNDSRVLLTGTGKDHCNTEVEWYTLVLDKKKKKVTTPNPE